MEPNWKPLEARLSPARCAVYMFMGRVNGINQYKHGISRRYLLLDDDGRAYQLFARNEFREIPIDEALALVEAAFKGDGRDTRNAIRLGLRASQIRSAARGGDRTVADSDGARRCDRLTQLSSAFRGGRVSRDAVN
jgi:hypothetical protein